jgi:hypothetical protein
MGFRSFLIALSFFALGFLVADRMAPAAAAGKAVAEDSNGAAFSGGDGAISAKSQILLIRGHKIYLVDPARGGTQRPWGDIVE